MTIPAGHAQLSWLFGGSGAPEGAMCTLGANVEDYVGDPSGLATTIIGLWEDSLLVEQHTSVTLIGATVKFGPDDVGPSGEASSNSDGATGGGGMPPQVAYLIRKNTAAGGVRFRGRMYIPGVPEAAVDEGGFVLTATINALQSGIEELTDNLVTMSVIPEILHEPSDKSATPPPTLITSYAVSSKVATQRRRLR